MGWVIYFVVVLFLSGVTCVMRLVAASTNKPPRPKEHWEYFADLAISVPLWILAYRGLS